MSFYPGNYPLNPIMFANPVLPDLYWQTKSPQQMICELYKTLNSLIEYTNKLSNYYVPQFKGEWSAENEYDPNDLVVDESGNTWVALKPVPKGTPLDESEYWHLAYPYSAQFEQLKELVNTFDGRLTDAESAIETIESNLVKTPEQFMTEGKTVAQALTDAANSGYIIDGRGRSYTVDAGITATGKLYFKNMTIEIADIECMCSLITCSRGSIFDNVTVNGNGICKNIVHTVTATDTEATPTLFMYCNFNTALNSCIWAESAIMVIASRFSSAEIGVDAFASDSKIYESIFRNCRHAINAEIGSGGLTLNNVHVWCTRYPNEVDTYSDKQSNTAYPGTSCLIYALSPNISIKIGQIYIDTVTYCIMTANDLVFSYPKVSIDNLSFFINRSFYNNTEQAPNFTNNTGLYTNSNASVMIGNALIDYNNVVFDDVYFYDSTSYSFESHFFVANYYAYPDISTIDMYSYKKYVYFGTRETSALGTESVVNHIEKTGLKKLKFYMRAGINGSIDNGSTIASYTFKVDISNVDVKVVYYNYDTKLYTELSPMIDFSAKTITIVNDTGGAMTNGFVQAL